MSEDLESAASSWPGSRSGVRRRVLAGLGFLLVAAMLAQRLLFLAHAAPTDFDDAYAYLRYAEHWLAGQGLAWNLGQGSVYGVTSLLHLCVVTAIRWAFPRLAMWQVLQVASGAAAIGLLAALSATAALSSRDPRLARNWIFWAAAVLALLPFHEAFGFHAGTGMDTMLSALANTVVVFLALHLAARPSPGRVALAVAGGLFAVLARPENLLGAALCPPLAIGLLARGPRAKPMALFCAGFAAVVGLLALGTWWWLGSPVPLSFFAKQPWYYGGFASEFAWNPFRFLAVFLLSAWPFLAVLIVFCDRLGVRRATVLLVPALLTMVALFRFNQIMGHLGRFYYPLLPFFAIAGVLEFDGWLARVRAGQRPRLPGMAGRAALAIVALVAIRAGMSAGADLYQARADQQSLPAISGYHVSAPAPLPDVDSWEAARRIAALAAAAPAGASFAMSEHGLPGAVAPQIEIIDVLGLHDPFFARHGFSARELFRRQPDLIWLPHADHTQMLRDILGSDEFWSHYDFYPDAFFHGIALRKSGPRTAALAALLASAWHATYPEFTMADYRASRGD